MKDYLVCPNQNICKIYNLYKEKKMTEDDIIANEENKYFCKALKYNEKLKPFNHQETGKDFECALVETLNNQEKILDTVNSIFRRGI